MFKLTQRGLAELSSELARTVDGTEVTQPCISEIERARVNVTDNTKWLLAATLRCQVSDLFPYPNGVPKIKESA